MYRRSDFASQMEAGLGAPGLAEEKKRRRRRRLSWDSCSSAGSGTSGGTGSEAGSDFAGQLSPEQRMASISLRQKFQAAGIASGAAAAPPRAAGGSDTFRIGTAPAPIPSMSPAPEQQQQQHVHPSPPTAPPLTSDALSARSLGSARRPRQWGTWAAAAAPPAAVAAATGSRSAPGSALNSARSASAVQLLPAVEALSPMAQAELPGLALAGAAAEAAPSPLLPGASGGSAGGSALQRAGSALARLKLLSRRNS